MLLEKHLEEHIRFEERELFGKNEAIATEEQFQVMSTVKAEDIKAIESRTDEFWV